MMNYIKQSWVILFGGSGREGVIERLVSEGVNVKLILVPYVQSSKLKESVARLNSLGIIIKEISRKNLGQALEAEQQSCLLSVGFPYIIPKSIYSKHKAALNIHPTLLPKYRGPTTGAYILINNEPESGSTIHFLDEEADKGDIILQSRVALNPFDTVRSVQRKVYKTEPSLIIEALRNLDLGKIPFHQDERIATSYPKKRKPEDSEIDPTRPLLELINKIRASDPEDFPAFFYLNGQKVYVKIWRKNKPIGSEDEL